MIGVITASSSLGRHAVVAVGSGLFRADAIMRCREKWMLVDDTIKGDHEGEPYPFDEIWIVEPGEPIPEGEPFVLTVYDS